MCLNTWAVRIQFFALHFFKYLRKNVLQLPTIFLSYYYRKMPVPQGEDESDKLILRYTIRDLFTEKLSTTCNMKSRRCRGGSKDLYKLLIASKAMEQDMNLDRDHLQIVSGIGHTFIRYKDDKHNRYLYIDPTIAQFDPTFQGIFVGDEQDLRNIVNKQLNMKGYKLDLSDYLGPPLTTETQLMNESSSSGGTRRRKVNRRKVSKRRKTARK